MFVVFQDSDRMRVERFKQATGRNCTECGARCIASRRAYNFTASRLREITISFSGCCARLMELANARIAVAETAETDLRKPA